MADLSIQFHALPSEISVFAREILDRYHLSIVSINYPPYAVSLIGIGDLKAHVEEGLARRLAFKEGLFDLPVGSQTEFVDKNPGVLYLDIGRLTDSGLSESWLACRTGARPMNQIWKKIAADLKFITKAGAIAVDSKTGKGSNCKNHRFTSGAKSLSEKGIPIRPIAGTVVYKLEENK